MVGFGAHSQRLMFVFRWPFHRKSRFVESKKEGVPAECWYPGHSSFPEHLLCAVPRLYSRRAVILSRFVVVVMTILSTASVRFVGEYLLKILFCFTLLAMPPLAKHAGCV